MPFAILRTPDGNRIVATNGGSVGVASNLPSDSVPFLTTAKMIGPNEGFTLVSLGKFSFALKTANGHFVSAPNGGGLGAPSSVADGAVALTTNGTVSGPKETFYIIPISRENNLVAIQTEDHSYVTAVNGGGIGAPPGYSRDQWPLVADSSEISDDCKFVIHYEPRPNRVRSGKPTAEQVAAQKARFEPLTSEAGAIMTSLSRENSGLLQKLHDKLITGEQLIWGPLLDEDTMQIIQQVRALPEFMRLANAGTDHFSNRQGIAFGINFGVAAVLDLEGFIGFLIDFDADSGAVIISFEFGLKTNIEAHYGLQGTYYFVPASDVLGWGFSFMLGAGEGTGFSVGFTINGGQFAPTVYAGLTAGVLPIDAAGIASYTWGSKLASLTDPTASAKSRVLVTLKNGDVMHNDGSDDVWTRLSTPRPVSYTLSWGTRVAYVTTNNTLYAMEGALDPIPAVQYDNVNMVQLVGNRIGVSQGWGKGAIVFYKEGALNAGWTSTEYRNLTNWTLLEDRLAVIDSTTNDLLVKPKAWNSNWVTVAKNIKKFSLSSDQILYVDQNSVLHSASGTDLNSLTYAIQLPDVFKAVVKSNTMTALKTDLTLWHKGSNSQDNWQKVASDATTFAMYLNPKGTAYDRLAYVDSNGALRVRDDSKDNWHVIYESDVVNFVASFERIVVQINDGQFGVVHIYDGPASAAKLTAQISGATNFSISWQDTFPR
ncbi:hypothetical protein AADZ86_00800 [Colwelliaceae bacterium BS250]